MSIVIGIAGHGWAVVATDSRQLIGSHVEDGGEKLFVNERLAVGMAGDLGASAK
jgi:20S proteasome alpha/beta subunit